MRSELATLVTIALMGAGSGAAHAVPAYARKYQTSCQTCHTVYPKLNPFGEAFRRDGHRFPGVDEDAIKEKLIPLGQEAQRTMFPKVVLPSFLASAPLAVAITGAAVAHPDTGSSAAEADNGAEFSLANLVEELAIFGAGSFTENSTFFAEAAIGEDGVEIEHASVWFSNLVGPEHAVGIRAGKTNATLFSFGPHSSYLADAALPPVPVTALFGGQSDSWELDGHYDTVEVTGVLAGRADYAVGINAGANEGVWLSESFYAHGGYKLGGMRMDGEGSQGPANPLRPWEETAITFQGFGYRSVSHFIDAADALQEDDVWSAGGGVRGQWKSLELDAAIAYENHDSAIPGGAGVDALTQWDELSYIVYPWLVPAIRFEWIRLDPDGGDSVNGFRLLPGVAGLIFANLKLTLIGRVEWADGAPPAGWGPSGAAAAPEAPDESVDPEIESIELGLSYAF